LFVLQAAPSEGLPWCEKRHFLKRHLYIKVIFLPRQARDKHRESTQKRCRYSQGADELTRILIAHCHQVRVRSRTIGVFESFPYVCPEPVLAK
jgi:hypothetical protein